MRQMHNFRKVKEFYDYYDNEETDSIKSKIVSYIREEYKNEKNPFRYISDKIGNDYHKMQNLLLSIFTSYDLLFKEYDTDELTFQKNGVTTLKQLFKKCGYDYFDYQGGCNIENMQSICDIAFDEGFNEVVKEYSALGWEEHYSKNKEK